MIDGMSEICIDCIHQEVCRYECHCPSEHCNDYAVADDFRPQATNNAELFKQTFGIYATEVWSMSERQFLKWLGTEVEE